MEIMDIIKKSFIFPSNNLDKLALYIVLTFAAVLLLFGGISFFILSSESSAFVILGVILSILSLIVIFVTMGYKLAIMKSGINQDEKAPSFNWKNDIVSGIKVIVLNIVYFIVPAIIVVIVALITNIPGNFMQIVNEFNANVNATAINSTVAVGPVVSNASLEALGSSLIITAIVAIILFIIFSFLESMGEARLANTGSLGNGLNIIEAAKDIPRIGVGKVIATILLVIIIMVVIQGILSYIYGQIPQLGIISVIVTPYLTFFAQRAYGLLYSDIA
ncbi:MAG: DUF4013 domain-containing protein [Methanobrevibacter sp.]|uniref:DUF4013 domain-containing protein n=1 Tax=Methanobrevibacter sp. TaxID=66852 RepID=UPI003F118BFA